MRTFLHRFRPEWSYGLPLGIGMAWFHGPAALPAQVVPLERPDPAATAPPAAHPTVSIYRFQNGQWVLTKGDPAVPLPKIKPTASGASKLFLATNASGATPVLSPRQPSSASGPKPAEPASAPKANASVAARANPPKAFPKIKIQGGYYRANNPSVIINGETLFEDGWQGKLHVLSITRSNVVLEMEGERREFKID